MIWQIVRIYRLGSYGWWKVRRFIMMQFEWIVAGLMVGSAVVTVVAMLWLAMEIMGI